MAIVLVNSDNTVNYIGEKIIPSLSLEGVTVKELPNMTVSEVMNGIPAERCVWDEDAQMVRDELEYPDLVIFDSPSSQ